LTDFVFLFRARIFGTHHAKPCTNLLVSRGLEIATEGSMKIQKGKAGLETVKGRLMATADVGKIANALNLTEQRVQQLVKEGLPREARGRYDPEKCLRFYVRYLQKALKKKSVPTLEGGYVGEREERVRLLRSQADLSEIELAKQRGQLVAIQDAERAMTDLVLTTKARILAVAPRIAPDLIGVASRAMAHAIVEKGLKEALLSLAKYEPK
jgi:phage terminase Nu1 subunit (DNA packaging protein)